MKQRNRICFGLALLLVLSLAACGLPRGVQTVAVSGPAPVAEEILQTTLNPVETLTGLPRPEGDETGLRLVAVVVDNISHHRVHRGLTEAGIVFELPVEGGITRLVAFYEHAARMPVVGNVRSNRDYFVDLAIPFGALFVFDGQAPLHREYIEAQGYEEYIIGEYFGGTGRTAHWRANEPGARTEYTSYTDGETVLGAIEAYEMDGKREYRSTYFLYAPPGEVPALAGEPASFVSITHSGAFKGIFEYSEGRYLWWQYNPATGTFEEDTDANTGEQIAFDNLLVLFGHISKRENSELVNIQYDEGGSGYYISGGVCQPILWEKPTPLHGFTLLHDDGAGTPLVLNPGTCYVTILGESTWEAFSYE